MSDLTRQQWVTAVRGVAAIAQTGVEMGLPDQLVREQVVGMFGGAGLRSSEDMLAVAEAIRSNPQPLDEPADEREGLRLAEALAGAKSPEEQLSAQLRARELVLDLAGRFQS